MKPKIQRALTAAILGAVATPLLMSVGCDGAEESGSTEVLRTYQGQTEVVTLQTPGGEQHTVLLDAEGEERAQVIRDLDGNRTGSLDDAELPARLWNAVGDELQPLHDLLHTFGQPTAHANDTAEAPTHPGRDASLAPATDPAAWLSSSCKWYWIPGESRWIGYMRGSTYFSQAQCSSFASSCGSNAAIEHYGSIPGVFGPQMLCYFTTD